MGRTIHWDIVPDKPFTDAQINKMWEISNKYNSGKFADVWSCENFWCNPYDYYPNWDDPERIFGTSERDKYWDKVNKMYASIFNSTRSHAKTCRELHKKGYILFHDEYPKNKAYGFCKVQGNEFNSLLVYLALIEISKAIPNANIRVNDEGEFLLCKVKLRNGKAWPDLHELKSDIHRYAGYTLLSKKHFLAKIPELKELHKDIAKDLGFNNGYGERPLQYLNEALRNLKVILKRIAPEFEKNNRGGRFGPAPFCIHNIMNPPGYDPLILSRADEVDVKKFVNYKISPGTLMDGFRGEGFGLANPEDAIKLSNDMIGFITKALGDNEGNLQVLGDE